MSTVRPVRRPGRYVLRVCVNGSMPQPPPCEVGRPPGEVDRGEDETLCGQTARSVCMRNEDAVILKVLYWIK